MRARRIIVVVVVAACGFHAGKSEGIDAPSTDADTTADAAVSDASYDASVDAAGCPAGYGTLGTAPSKYRVVGGGSASPTPGRTNWVGAEADCRDDGVGTHLAVAETQAENQAFIDVLSGASRWLGVSDRKVEGTWIPIIQTTGWYVNWAGGTPDVEDCLLLSRTSFHEAMPCQSALSQWDKGFICECDGATVDVAAF